jgi:hypothetical protein
MMNDASEPDLAGPKSTVVLRVTGEQKNLELGFTGFVEEGFELFAAVFVGVGEGVVEDEW